MLSSKFLKEVMTEAYPIIERQINDAKVISSFRELVTANGGDWSALKALMKAHVEDSLDDSGDGKRVRKILDKADSSNAYAEMLGLANMNDKNFISYDDDQDDSEPDPISALLSNSALGLVRASDLKKSEPQLSQPAGSDLTSLAPHEGQVAPNSHAKASTDGGATGEAIEQPADSVTGDASRPSVGGGTDASNSAASAMVDAQEDAAGVGSSAPAAPKYAEKGVVTWESTPPEGVERHPYSNAFGTLGQDAVVIADDIAMARAAPIVKIGNVILDGWARYMTARGSVGLTGQSTEYPVVQYDGTDPLIDCIKWNIAGRILSDKDKQTVAQRLIAIEPKRKAEILKAVAELAI